MFNEHSPERVPAPSDMRFTFGYMAATAVFVWLAAVVGTVLTGVGHLRGMIDALAGTTTLAVLLASSSNRRERLIYRLHQQHGEYLAGALANMASELQSNRAMHSLNKSQLALLLRNFETFVGEVKELRTDTQASDIDHREHEAMVDRRLFGIEDILSRLTEHLETRAEVEQAKAQIRDLGLVRQIRPVN